METETQKQKQRAARQGAIWGADLAHSLFMTENETEMMAAIFRVRDDLARYGQVQESTEIELRRLAFKYGVQAGK